MKKLNLFVLGMSILLSGCACSNCKDGKCDGFALGCSAEEAPVVATATADPAAITVLQPTDPNSKIKYYVVEQDTGCISETSMIKAPIVDKSIAVDASEYKSFGSRVAIKATGDNAVTYEYRDVRVDELMPLAAHYCSEHGNRTAILRKINLYHGYYRRVTFDCVNL